MAPPLGRCLSMLLALGAAACAPGEIGLGSGGGSGGAAGARVGGGAGSSGSGGASAAPGPGAAGPTSMQPGAAPTVPLDGDLLAPRIRRLSNAELDGSFAALLGVPLSAAPARSFAPDTRQSDFTRNAAQRVDPVYAAQLQAAARELAKQAAVKLVTAVACASGDACARTFIADFVPKVFRRPITDEEKSDLLAVFQAGAAGATFTDGVDLVVTAVLQAPSFLYLTELGSAPARDGLTTLAPYEIASSLSYLLVGGPPDRPLTDAATNGKLAGAASAAEREAQARRLLLQPGARLQVQRLVKEWLGIDHLESTGKDAKVYPKFEELRPLMAAETDAFIAEVAFADDGTLARLLSADYTIVEPKLGSFYGLSGVVAGRRTSLAGTPRRGLLTHASFLSVHGHDVESAPVKRGAVILKKLLCAPLPTPSELNLMVVPPKPDPKLTTRERFAVHARDPECAACHRMIDPLGFALEAFDGMGGFRTTENRKPVDTAVELLGAGVTGAVKDSIDLASRLAQSDTAGACLARNFVRFAAAQTGAALEDRFLREVWEKLPPARRSSLPELLVAFAASDLFVTRRAAP